jgi:hypothetical protein
VISRWVGAAAAAAAVLVGLSGCVPPSPDDPGWREDARKTLGDVGSELATAKLVLRARAQDRFVGRYDQVVLAYAEEAAGKAADTLAAEQPPDTELKRYRTVTDALDQATSLLSEARIAVVSGRPAACATLCPKLEAANSRLQKLEKRMSGPSLADGQPS